ncbi:MAG: HDOD domain-containing protein [Myxococcota bacterium]
MSKNETAESFVQGSRELPVMPPVATEVIRRAEDPDTDLATISQLISRDASLAVRVLKIANSSFYSMPREVETLHQAIVLLGYSTLRSIVVAASMKDVFAHFGLAERLLWEHAVGAGVAASALARIIGGLSPDEVFVGGLLHDIGKLVMHSQAEDRYQQVLQRVYADEQTSVEAELETFGFDHSDVGLHLLRRWKLSERLSCAVGSHHDLSRADAVDGAKPLAALLQVADRLCLREGIGRRKPEPELDILECAGAELLGVGLADVEDLVASFQDQYEQERQVFG